MVYGYRQFDPVVTWSAPVIIVIVGQVIQALGNVCSPGGAAAAHRPASQVARELMREYVQRQRQAREYEDFLTAKVQASRRSLHAGEGIDHAEVEAEFARRRAAAQ